MNANASISRADEPVHPGHRLMNAEREGARALAHAGVVGGAGTNQARPRAARRGTKRRWNLSTDQIANVLALIQAGRFELAVREVRALPAATPELPVLLGGLVWGLAEAGELEATVALLSEMLARFPLRPELIRTLVGVAEIMAGAEDLKLVFEALGVALRRTYGFQDVALFELAQRMAYQFRRHGNADASACILRTWRALMFN
jgi:hypothetical protein